MEMGRGRRSNLFSTIILALTIQEEEKVEVGGREGGDVG